MGKNDEQIIQEYLSGDEAAFSEIVKIYLKPIYNFVYRLTNDRDAADDLTQETFVKVWKNINKFDPRRKRNLDPYRIASSGSGFKTWLFAIAKNTTFDWFKKKKEIPFSKFADEEGESWLENIEDENILPDEILQRKNISEELGAVLQKLPPHYRAILLLHYKEEFSLHEIAEILDESYNTIKSRHQRGLVKLKELLK